MSSGPTSALEGFARREIRERRRRAADVQPAHVQFHRPGRRGWGGRGRVGGELGDEVGEIERAVLVHLHADERFGRADFLEHPGVAEKGGELEIHINFVPRNERLAVLVLDQQAADGRREDERIDFDLLNRDFAVELPGQLLDRHAADNRRQNEKADDGVKQHQPENPEPQLAFARRQSELKSAPSSATAFNQMTHCVNLFEAVATASAKRKIISTEGNEGNEG